MIVIGIDPDLHNTAYALADDKRVYAVGIARVDEDLRGEVAVVAMCAEIADDLQEFCNEGYLTVGCDFERAVVEAQELYLGGDGDKSKPDDLLNLANVTGAALCVLAGRGYETRRPLPKVWKGQRPKKIHQTGLCLKLGWAYEERSGHVVPTSFAQQEPAGAAALKPADWKHVMDAIGLAMWGATKGFKS